MFLHAQNKYVGFQTRKIACLLIVHACTQVKQITCHSLVEFETHDSIVLLFWSSSAWLRAVGMAHDIGAKFSFAALVYPLHVDAFGVVTHLMSMVPLDVALPFMRELLLRDHGVSADLRTFENVCWNRRTTSGRAVRLRSSSTLEDATAAPASGHLLGLFLLPKCQRVKYLGPFIRAMNVGIWQQPLLETRQEPCLNFSSWQRRMKHLRGVQVDAVGHVEIFGLSVLLFPGFVAKLAQNPLLEYEATLLLHFQWVASLADVLASEPAHEPHTCHR